MKEKLIELQAEGKVQEAIPGLKEAMWLDGLSTDFAAKRWEYEPCRRPNPRASWHKTAKPIDSGKR